jgi:hypothetical protein
MRRLVTCLLLAAASCGDFNIFGDQRSNPDAIPCSDAGTCPPNEVCVPNERICRYACQTDADCSNAHMSQEACDIDHYCRTTCGSALPQQMCGGPTQSLRGCPTGQICDTQTGSGICRLICAGVAGAPACPTGFTCATAVGTSCSGCRPGP